jgi:hypothetical protein
MTVHRMIGKASCSTCEAVTQEVRRLPPSALLALRLLPGLSRAPCLIRDRNGRGDRYVTLRYLSAAGKTRRLCLQGLDLKDETMLRAAVTGWWPKRARMLTETICSLRARIRRNRSVSRALAECCGCRFHGTLLRIPRKKP